MSDDIIVYKIDVLKEDGYELYVRGDEYGPFFEAVQDLVINTDVFSPDHSNWEGTIEIKEFATIPSGVHINIDLIDPDKSDPQYVAPIKDFLRRWNTDEEET